MSMTTTMEVWAYDTEKIPNDRATPIEATRERGEWLSVAVARYDSQGRPTKWTRRNRFPR